jgi:phospholipid/cholesterol/gamma-HCH transport system substrate-binding protein
MTSSAKILIKFGVYATVMVAATVFLFAVFAEVRTGPTVDYSAVFKDASRLKSGDSVRVAGVRVGTVGGVSLRPDRTELVKFNADRDIPLTTGTKAAVRYLNLVGDRYLELEDGPGSTRLLPAGAQIPVERTAPALDLDLLLNGLKPVVRGLNPQDVNALTASLIQIMQGQGGTLDSLMSQTSSFSNSLADNHQVIDSLIDELRTVLATLNSGDKRLSGAIERLSRLVGGLAADRDPIGTAVAALDRGTASIADLLGSAREPLTKVVTQVDRLTTAINADLGGLDMSLQKAPENYRKAIRLGAYGGFIQYYLCAVQIRVSDTQGRTAVFPWIKSEEGRCSDTD